jgi:RHS repeat-associated protein
MYHRRQESPDHAEPRHSNLPSEIASSINQGVSAPAAGLQLSGTQYLSADSDCQRVVIWIQGQFTGNGSPITFYLWDDGILKDSKTISIPNGVTRQVDISLGFLGYYLHGAPGVGIYVDEGAGRYRLSDPFYPVDAQGNCKQVEEVELGPESGLDCQSWGCPAWQVNKTNLNFYMTDTPLWYSPAFGPAVELKLSYNSRSQISPNSVFGNKWSFGYGGYVAKDDGSTVTIILGNGKQQVYTRNADGSYLASRGNYEILKKLPDSVYELKYRDGTAQYFSIPAGTSSQYPRLTKLINLQGHFLQFEYDQTAKLVGIVDAQGKRTGLEYSELNRITKVTDPFGRFASFSYDSNGDLVAITDMGGYTSLMAYAADSYIASLTKPESGAWQFYLEPSDGIVTHEQYPDSGAAMWDSYRITITDPSNKKTEYFYNGFGGYSWFVNARDYDYLNPRNHLDSEAKTIFRTDFALSRLTSIEYPGEEQEIFGYNSFGSNTSHDNGVVSLTRTFNSANQKISETINPSSSNPRATQYEYQSPTSYLRTRILKSSVAPGQQAEQTIQYDSAGNPTQVSLHGFTLEGTAVERIYQYSYDSLGRLVEENGPRTDVSDITQYTYYNCDPGVTGGHCDRLATITNALGHTTTINSYTPNGLVSQMTDPNGKITLYSYDGLDRLISVTERTEPTGTDRTTQFTYIGPKRLASVTLPDGATLTYTYDSTEKLISITDNLGNKIEYTNDANGNKIEEKVFDASNNLVRSVANIYDLRNRKTSVTSGGIVTQYGSYRNNLICQIVDGRSNATAQEYDDFGQLVKITPPAGSLVTYQYNVHGNITQAAVANGPVTNYTYDDLGNLLKEVSPDRGIINWTYDVAGNRISQVDGRNVAVSFSYDALNRLIQETYPDNSTVSYQYDTAPNGIGRLASVTDFSGNTSFAYNKFGQMVQKSQTVAVGAGSTALAMQFEYDSVGRLTKKTYPSGLEVAYGYDAVGRISQIQLNGEPWLSEVRYQPFGGVTEQHWADGRITIRSYDIGGKLTGHTLDEDQRALAYDLSGNIQALSDSTVSRIFDYDPINRLIIAQGFVDDFAWQYDGNTNRITEHQGTYTDTYSYAAATNRLLEITGSGTSQFGYDGAGNMTINGNTAYSYNARGQLSAVSNGITTVANYQYNGFNQRVLKTADGQERIFVYDTDGMLLSEHEANGETIVQYVNFNGEVLAANTDDQTTSPPSPCQGITAKVSDHMGALRAYVTTEVINGIITVSYRAHGSHDRLGSDALATVTLYANGFNFWQISDPGNCGNSTVGPCPATTTSNQEHKDNNRAYTQTTGAWWWTPGTTTYYAQGSNNNLGTSGTTLTTLYQGANGSWYKTDPADCPIEQAAGWLYYHNDHLGTPQKVTNAEGEVVWAATVNPFGDVIETVTDFEQNIRFPGQYHDRETGLYYNWHRYYSPELGRYITSDPIGLEGGLNTYAYVGGNPVNAVDPSGLFEVILFQPSGNGGSSFGHIATIGGSTYNAYSFGRSGMHIESFHAYMARNNFRNAIGYQVKLPPDQEEKLEQCLTGYGTTDGQYWLFTNSCVDPLARCLERQGEQLEYLRGNSNYTPAGLFYTIQTTYPNGTIRYYPALPPNY